jgi:hypothetical protein
VLSRDSPADSSWSQLQVDLLTRSRKSKRLVANGAGHMIQEEQPESVIAAIRELVTASREAARPAGDDPAHLETPQSASPSGSRSRPISVQAPPTREK